MSQFEKQKKKSLPVGKLRPTSSCNVSVMTLADSHWFCAVFCDTMQRASGGGTTAGLGRCEWGQSVDQNTHIQEQFTCH